MTMEERRVPWKQAKPTDAALYVPESVAKMGPVVDKWVVKANLLKLNDPELDRGWRILDRLYELNSKYSDTASQIAIRDMIAKVNRELSKARLAG